MDLKHYVESVKNLEVEKRTLSKTIQSIDETIKDLVIPEKIWRKSNPINLKVSEVCGGQILCAIFFAILGFTILGLGINSNYEMGCILTGVIFFIVAAGAALSGFIQYRRIVADYKQNEETIEYNYQLAIRNDDARLAKERIIKQQYLDARSKLYDTYVKTCDTLSALYNQNVIYPKYKNDIVAICMFSEYFESGRCDSLTGHEGAYNIYENEVRMGTIISKLDVIIQKLDEIERNQYGLYTALQQISAQQNRIINNLEQITHNQNRQNETLEYIEYNSSVLKMNSDIAMIYELNK